jgi:hypothetical protein
MQNIYMRQMIIDCIKSLLFLKLDCSCLVRPFLATHLNQTRTSPGKSEDLFLPCEHRASSNSLIRKSLDICIRISIGTKLKEGYSRDRPLQTACGQRRAYQSWMRRLRIPGILVPPMSRRASSITLSLSFPHRQGKKRLYLALIAC